MPRIKHSSDFGMSSTKSGSGSIEQQDSPLHSLDDNKSAESTGNVSTSSSVVTINDLPQPVLMKIFSYCSVTEILCSVRRVSTVWYELCRDRDVWKHKEISVGMLNDRMRLKYSEGVFTDYNVNLKELKPLLQYATGLCKLQVTRLYQIPIEPFNEALAYSSNMELLYLSGRDLKKELYDGSLFETIAEHCPKVSHLEIHCIYFHLQYNDFKCFGQIANLQVLVLENTKGITDDVMKMLFEYLKKLTRLELLPMKDMTGKVLEYLADSGLAITWLAIESQDECVKQEHLLPIARLSGLKVLKITGDVFINSEFLYRLAENCHNIECLELCDHADDFIEGFTFLVKNLQRTLKHMAFTGVRLSVDDLKPLADHCDVLQWLALKNTLSRFKGPMKKRVKVELTDEAFTNVVEALQWSLTHVSIEDPYPRVRESWHLSEVTLESLMTEYDHICFDGFGFHKCCDWKKTCCCFVSRVFTD